MLQSKYGFTICEEVVCSGETDFIIGFIEQDDEDNWKLGYRLILKNAGTQALSSVKRKLIKFASLYGNDGDILLPKILFYHDKKVRNNIECPKCESEMYDTDPLIFFESFPEKTTISCDCGFNTMRYVSEQKDWLELTLDLQIKYPLVMDVWDIISALPYESIEEITRIISATNERTRKLLDKHILPSHNTVTRLEVITSNGREYINKNISELELSYQDEGRTLKVFVK